LRVECRVDSPILIDGLWDVEADAARFPVELVRIDVFLGGTDPQRNAGGEVESKYYWHERVEKQGAAGIQW